MHLSAGPPDLVTVISMATLAVGARRLVGVTVVVAPGVRCSLIHPTACSAAVT
jgi:hypothetical protein